MSRRRRIAIVAGGSILGLLVILVVAGVLIVRSAWFANFVRQKIVASVEESTGGRTEVGSFRFQWTQLRADVYGFVVHGLELPGQAPLFSARHMEIDLKLLSPFKGFVDIAYLLVDTPRANVIVFPDGRTNIPAPKLKQPSQKSALETVVDLAIGRFDLVNGAAAFADRPARFDARGQNLRAHLTYNPLHPGYAGEIDIDPLNLQSGANPPLDVQVKLPLSMQKDRIALANAQLATAHSRIVLSGEMDHLNAPHTAAHVHAEVALEDVRRAAGLAIPLDLAHGPGFLTADVTASMDPRQIRIESARVALGASNLEAHGTLEDPNRPANVQFNATLALGQIGRLLKVAARPEGTLQAGGDAVLRNFQDYRITANLEARHVALTAGAVRLSGIDLDTAVAAGPQAVDLTGLRLEALGGSFAGSAAVQNLRAFRLAGDLHHFDVNRLAALFLRRNPGYDGVLSGPLEVSGDLKNPRDLVARTNLAIAPGSRGIPVAGRVNAEYNGRADSVVVLRPSYLQLPHTRVDVAGSAGSQVQVRLVSRNLEDFRPLGSVPVTLDGGQAAVNATITGKLSAPRVAAHLALTHFQVEGRPFTSFTGDIQASPSAAAVSNAVLARGPLQARLDGSVGLRDWQPEPYEPLRLDATVRNADLADVLALAGEPFSASGALTADAHITGTVGSPTGSGEFTVANGAIEGEHFDSLTARAAMTPTAIDVPALTLAAGPSHIDATASYQHAVNDLERGAVRAHIASNQVQLADLQPLLRNQPGLRGTLALDGDLTADVRPSAGGAQFEIANLDGNLAVRGLQMSGHSLGDLTATASTASGAVNYHLNSDFAGSTVRVTGQSLLAGSHATTANAQIANLPIQQALAVAGQGDLPLRGTLGATAQVSGTLQNPRIAATVSVVNGAAWNQPFDNLQATFDDSNTLLNLASFRLAQGSATLTASGSFAHPAGDFQNGHVTFRVATDQVQLARLASAQQAEPGLAGSVALSADGAATLRKGAAPLIASLNASLDVRALAMNGKPLGNLTATGRTSGQEVRFDLNSDLAHANIHGSGGIALTGDYPFTAQVSFGNLTYSGLSPLVGGPPKPFEAVVDGSVTIGGPLAGGQPLDTALHGSLQLSKVEAHAIPTSTGRAPRVTFTLQNAGPVVMALNGSRLTVQSARITGPMANLSLSGTAALAAPRTLDLRTAGNIKLELLEAFDADVFSAGDVTLSAAVAGTLDRPVVNGRLQLQNASVNLLNVPNGLSNANGVIAFNGTQAVIQNLTGESGGGKVAVAGVVAYGGPELQVRLTADAEKVRVDYPSSVTTEASARLSLAGTTTRNVLSGNITVLDVTLHADTDIGSLLTQAATPPGAAAPSTGLLAGMHFDVRVQTAPDVQFRTTLAQNLQAEANLTLRGTPDNPGMLGRVVVTEGNVVFFGAKYTIDQGTIAFYDPNRINPNLNINLQTKVQGIDVTISVSGPMDRLKMSYRSDPPMQFSDLISLLASGRPPSTDPVLAAHTPPAPEQNFEQAGASALFGAAVANPVAGRLQRLFGVTRLQINPQLTGTSNQPLATMTLQQQITPDIAFTYIQDVTQSNPQIIQVEWDFSPQWSAIAQRDINGFFDLDFFWKKRFH